MTDDCQDTFQHCVMKSEGDSNNSPRSSIVFKKSLPGLGGKRGHGLVKVKIDAPSRQPQPQVKAGQNTQPQTTKTHQTGKTATTSGTASAANSKRRAGPITKTSPVAPAKSQTASPSKNKK